MKTLASAHLLTTCQKLVQLVVVANFVMGCSTTINETDAAIRIGKVVEIHDVAAVAGISRYRPPTSSVLPTPENIAKVRQSFIDSGKQAPPDFIIQYELYHRSHSPADIPAEPDHKLYVLESRQGTKLYVRSTKVFVVGTCIEILPQAVHREKFSPFLTPAEMNATHQKTLRERNSWLLWEATTEASTRC